MKSLKSSLSSVMMNVMHLRNGKKAYVIYAVGLFVVCSVGLVMKNFNDKIALMSDSVHSYQAMIDKQSEQMKTITREKERFKRELAEEKEVNEQTVAEMKNSLHVMEEKHKLETTRLEKEIMDNQEDFHELEQQKSKLEAKYKTLSKANGAAVADIEYFKAENKKIKSQLHDASTSKTSEQLALRDSMAKISVERDKYKDQYTALFKQQQQSLDTIQLLQNEKDRLQEQIREIQRLSGGSAGSSSQVPEVHQVQPESGAPASALTSSSRPMAVPQVMEEPAQGQEVQPSSSTSSSLVGEAAGPAIAQAPPPLQEQAPGAKTQAKGLPPLQARAAPQAARQPVMELQQVRRPDAFRPVQGGYQPAKASFNGDQGVYNGGQGVYQLGQLPYQAYQGGYRGQEVKPIQPQKRIRGHPNVIDDDELMAPLAPRAKKVVPLQGGWYPGIGGQGQYMNHVAPQMAPQVAKYGGAMLGGWGQGHQEQIQQDSWHEPPGFRVQDNDIEETGEGDEVLVDERPYHQQVVNKGRDF